LCQTYYLAWGDIWFLGFGGAVALPNNNNRIKGVKTPAVILGDLRLYLGGRHNVLNKDALPHRVRDLLALEEL
jgi:hypothetical protein